MCDAREDPHINLPPKTWEEVGKFLPPASPRGVRGRKGRAPTRGRPCGHIPCGEDAPVSRVFVASRVGVGDDSPRRSPPGAHKGSPLRMPLRGMLRMRLCRACSWRGAWGWATIPPPPPRAPRGAHKGSPLRMPLRGMLRMRLCRACSWRRAWGWATISPAVPREAPTRDRPYGCPCGACYGCACVARVRGVARGGGRRFPPPCPARRPQGIAPTDAPAGHVTDAPVSRVFVAWRVGVGDDSPAVPRQAPTRDAPTDAPTDAPADAPAGHVTDAPVSRVFVASRVGVGDDSPRRAPPGAHKGSPLRMPLRGMSGGFPFARESIFITRRCW